ncbi:CAP-Gly domain containing protein [Cladophialophora carrionii]|uniref:CAP-Gly domain containing protein n=1 Tax=Cladophialophora carrionii TaxID=86049 RepID=A0A1C1CTM6_9EURO|nr:CAP-Gly domain containing protein [Cladophialophora carrionii]
MATGEYYHGQRRSYAGALCTVRYFGPLRNAQGEWLGVEWDDPSRGKHDGQHEGRRVFRCLSSSPTAASFLRPSRKPDQERTLLEAIKFKYAPSSVPGRHDGDATIEISGKVVEEVGFERIQEQLSVLADLKIVLVDELVVSGIAPRAASAEDIRKAQHDLARTCPNITELDVGWNVVETWQDVLDMCAPLRKLKILKAGGLRLRDFRARVPIEHPLRSINELYLNENLLTPVHIVEVLFFERHCNFESLRTLSLSLNDLTSLDFDASADDDDWRRCPSVTSVILDNNKFTRLSFLPTLLGLFPNLTSLSLQGNTVSTVGLDSSVSFSTLETLNLAGNCIQEYSFLDRLPILFPNLTSLRISRNPLYDPVSDQDEADGSSAGARRSHAPSSTSDSTSYYLTLARIPGLKSLNYTTITPRDREEGEIYYLSVAEREIKTILASTDQGSGNATTDKLCLARQKHPLYSILCAKYDRDDLLQIYVQTQSSAPTSSQPADVDDPKNHTHAYYAPGTLGSRLVDAFFYIPSSAAGSAGATSPSSSAPPPFHRLLPTTISVFRVKSLVARHFGLPALSFALVYESHEYDPVEPIHSTRNTGVGTWGKESWDGWGDWDVDQEEQEEEQEDNEEEQEQKRSEHRPLRGGGETKTESESETENERDRADTEAASIMPMFIVREGHRFKKRETYILDGMRPWGDFLDVDDPAPPPLPPPPAAAASAPGRTRRRDVRVRVELGPKSEPQRKGR